MERALILHTFVVEDLDPNYYSLPVLLLREDFIQPSVFLLTYIIIIIVPCLKHNSKTEPIMENGNSSSETKTISTANGNLMETQDKDVVSEGLGSVVVYDQWIAPPLSGQRPKARYEVLLCQS